LDHDLTQSAIPCSNCGSVVRGKFCGECGQALGPPVRPLPVFLRESLKELTSLNGAFARSVATLIHAPGALTVDYLAGKRAGFLSPVRLFVDVGVGAFLLTWLIPQSWPLFGIGPELFGGSAGPLEVLAAAAAIPVGALAHWLALRRVRPMVMEHGVFVLHVTAFSFLLAPIEGLLYFLAPDVPVLQTAAALFAPIVWGLYWLRALARFLDKPIRHALLDGFRVYLVTVGLLLPAVLYVLLLG